METVHLSNVIKQIEIDSMDGSEERKKKSELQQAAADQGLSVVTLEKSAAKSSRSKGSVQSSV